MAHFFSVGDRIEVLIQGFLSISVANWFPATVLPSVQNETGERQIRVAFDNTGQACDVDVEYVRPRITQDSDLQPVFRVGRIVEVESYEQGYVGSWYRAKILEFAGNGQYVVDYTTLADCTELVDGFRIRPLPPKDRRDGVGYTLLDQVDAKYKGGWWIGQICRVGADRQTGERRYSVYFWTSSEVISGFPDWKLRPRYECVGRRWTATPKSISRLEPRARVGELVTALQHGAGSSRSFTFPTGADKIVEVRSDVEGFRSAWFPALVAQRNKITRKYYLEVLGNANGDGTGLDWVVADERCMRPSPPPFEMTGPFMEGEPVEAWIHGGWFEGKVRRLLGEARYMVRLLLTGETLEFRFLELRPHQQWTSSGDWVSSSEGRVVSMEEA